MLSRPYAITLRPVNCVHNAPPPLPRGTGTNVFLSKQSQQYHVQSRRKFATRPNQVAGRSGSHGNGNGNGNASMESHWGPPLLPRRQSPLVVREFMLSLADSNLNNIWRHFTRVSMANYLDDLSNNDLSLLLHSLSPRKFFHKRGHRAQLGSKIGKRGYYAISWDDSVQEFWGRIDEVLRCMKQRDQALRSEDYTHLLECARWTQKRSYGERLWQEMLAAGIKPTTWTYNSYIALGVGTPKDGLTRLVTGQRIAERRNRALVNKIGDMETRTRTIFNNMLADGLQPSNMTVDLLILSSSRYGNINAVFEFLSNFWGITFMNRTTMQPVWIAAPAPVPPIGKAEERSVRTTQDKQSRPAPSLRTALDGPFDVKFVPTVSAGSPLYPSSHSIHTVVTVFCQNFRFDIALQAFDILSEGYNLKIFPQTWTTFMRWAYTFASRKYKLFNARRVIELHRYIAGRHKNLNADLRITGWLFRSYVKCGRLRRAMNLLNHVYATMRKEIIPKNYKASAKFKKRAEAEAASGRTQEEILALHRDFYEYGELAQATSLLVKWEKLLETWVPRLLRAVMRKELRCRKATQPKKSKKWGSRPKLTYVHKQKVWALFRAKIVKRYGKYLLLDEKTGSIRRVSWNFPKLKLKRGPARGQELAFLRSKAL